MANMTKWQYLANILRSGTRESFTRVSAGLIVVSGVLGFIAIIVYIFINHKDLSGYEIAALIASITAYIALGVTGKYYGTKLEVQTAQPPYTSSVPVEYEDSELITTSSNKTNVKQLKQISMAGKGCGTKTKPKPKPKTK